VKVKSSGWALRMGSRIGVAWLFAGCGTYAVTATGGTTFRQSESLPDPLSSALRASASRDLPCESGDLDVARLDAEREYSVTGCGLRVLYRALTPSLTSRRLELVSRSAMGDIAAGAHGAGKL
jgi:hypothetical protein